VASDKVPDEGQKTGDEETLARLRSAFKQGDQSLYAADAVDHVFDVLKLMVNLYLK
jgi:hypothetical protein